MENIDTLIEELYDFKQRVVKKNPALPSRIADAIRAFEKCRPAFYPHEENLQYIIGSFKGIGWTVAGYISRLVNGETVDDVLKDVPEKRRTYKSH